MLNLHGKCGSKMRSNPARSVSLILLVVMLGVSALFLGAFSSELEQGQKIDPFLNYLVQRNKQSLQQRGEPLDIWKYQSEMGIYSGRDLVTPSLHPQADGGYSLTPTVAQDTRSVGVLIGVKGRAALFSHPSLRKTASVGSVLAASVPLTEISDLAANPEVLYIEPSRLLQPTLDQSVPAIGADVLHSHQPIDKGGNVLIGVVDSGIDYDHRDFLTSGNGSEENKSRILYIWDQTDTSGAGNTASVPYGMLYSKSDIESDIMNNAGPDEGIVREKDTVGHGTHVTGIAAGDGSSSGEGYVGVAPEASIVATKTSFYTSSVIDAVDYIHEVANDLGMPVVTNLSLGTQVGPHDGTSLFESTLNQLAGPDHVIVVSAGNSGDLRIHRGVMLSPGTTNSLRINVPDFTPSSEATDYVQVNGFYGSSGNVEVKVEGPSGDQTGWVAKGEMREFEIGGTGVLISNGPSGINQDNEIYLRIGELQEAGAPSSGEWEIVIRTNQSADLDCWVSSVLLGGMYREVEFEAGDTSMTIAEPGNAAKVITVGSYNTKNSWNGASVSGFPVGELSSFSSRGPTRDGRAKPEITAPGAWVVSSLSGSSSPSSLYTVADGKHWALAGTSMSAPHVAGAVALLWHAAPELTGGEIKERLQASATEVTNSSEGSLAWGAGKLDIQETIYSMGVPSVDIQEKLWVKATPNPADQKVDFFFNFPQDAEDVKIQIYNIVGKRVKVIRQSELEGKMKVEWNLRDGGGQRLANGLYIYLISTSNQRSGLHRLVIRR